MQLPLAIMALLALLIGPWVGPTDLPASGNATYYSDGLMESVAEYRLGIGDVVSCKECVGYVAMMRKGDIGRKIWLNYQGRISGPWLVVDCADPRDFPSVLKREIVVEVSYALAQEWEMAGPVSVTVLERPPPSLQELKRAIKSVWCLSLSNLRIC